MSIQTIFGNKVTTKIDNRLFKNVNSVKNGTKTPHLQAIKNFDLTVIKVEKTEKRSSILQNSFVFNWKIGHILLNFVQYF